MPSTALVSPRAVEGTRPYRLRHRKVQNKRDDGISYTFGDDSDVTFGLTPQDDKVLLLVTHRSRGDDLPELGNFASGWHSHLALLIALLEGATPPPFWATHQRRKEEYTRLLAAKPQ